MSDLHKIPQQSLEALEDLRVWRAKQSMDVTTLRAALAQQDEPETIDEAMRLPRAMAQAYENGYKAGYKAGYETGVAHERERCLRLIEDHVRAVDAEDVVRAIKEVRK